MPLMHAPEPVRPPDPEPPTPPGDGECCESGCGEACVWARYQEALDRYRQALATPSDTP